MIINTPPLATKTVNVVPLLFKAQLPDTLNQIRQAIPDWTAVHVVADTAIKRGATPQEIQAELLAQLKPTAALYDPIYTLSNPAVPPNTLFTLAPDRVRPTFAPEYDLWKYVYYADARELLGEFLDRALGGVPEGRVGIADALTKGKSRGPVALEGWTGSVGVPAFRRTMEAILEPGAPVFFWDTSFGFEATGETFIKTADLVLGLFGAKEDRLYFDAANFSWYAVFYPGGQMRIGLLS